MSLRLVPDLGDRLTSAMDCVAVLLVVCADWEADPGPGGAPVDLPPPLAGQQALDALRRIDVAVAPGQGRRAAEAGCTGRVLAPDGRELAALRVVDVDQADVDVLSAAAVASGRPRPGPDVRDALDAGAENTGLRTEQLVTAAARVAGLLDLTVTAQAALLIERLAAAEPDVDVTLTVGETAAHRHTAARLAAMWGAETGTDRWLY